MSRVVHWCLGRGDEGHPRFRFFLFFFSTWEEACCFPYVSCVFTRGFSCYCAFLCFNFEATTLVWLQDNRFVVLRAFFFHSDGSQSKTYSCENECCYLRVWTNVTDVYGAHEWYRGYRSFLCWFSVTFFVFSFLFSLLCLCSWWMNGVSTVMSLFWGSDGFTRCEQCPPPSLPAQIFVFEKRKALKHERIKDFALPTDRFTNDQWINNSGGSFSLYFWKDLLPQVTQQIVVILTSIREWSHSDFVLRWRLLLH